MFVGATVIERSDMDEIRLVIRMKAISLVRDLGIDTDPTLITTCILQEVCGSFNHVLSIYLLDRNDVRLVYDPLHMFV